MPTQIHAQSATPRRVVAVCCGADERESGVSLVGQLAPGSQDSYLWFGTAQRDLPHSVLPVERLSDTQALTPGRLVVAPTHRLVEFEATTVASSGIPGTLDMNIEAFARRFARRAVLVILSTHTLESVEGAAFAVLEVGGVVLMEPPFGGPTPLSERISAHQNGVVLAPEDMPGWIERRLEPGALPVNGSQRVIHRGLDLLRPLERGAVRDLNRYRASVIALAVRLRQQTLNMKCQNDYLAHYARDEAERSALGRALSEGAASSHPSQSHFEDLSMVFKSKAALLGPGHPSLRIWVAGCARLEEVWRVALTAEAAGIGPSCRFFVTDIDPDHLSAAQSGALGSERPAWLTDALLPFVEWTGSEWRVLSVLRDRIQFALHDLLEHPAFARIDVLVCRGLLGALTPSAWRSAQERLLRALRPGGHFVSESFVQLKGTRNTRQSGVSKHTGFDGTLTASPVTASRCANPFHTALLSIYAPPSILVTRDGSITQTHGEVQRLVDAVHGNDGPLKQLLGRYWAERRTVQAMGDGHTLVAQSVPQYPDWVMVSFAPAGSDTRG